MRIGCSAALTSFLFVIANGHFLRRKNLTQTQPNKATLPPITSCTLRFGALSELFLKSVTVFSTFRMERDSDDSFLNSPWADQKSLKRKMMGMNDVGWKPKWSRTLVSSVQIFQSTFRPPCTRFSTSPHPCPTSLELKLTVQSES